MMHLKSVYFSFSRLRDCESASIIKTGERSKLFGIRRFHAQGESVTGSSNSQSGDKSLTLNEPSDGR